MVICDQAELIALGEDGRFVVDLTIFETKGQSGIYRVPVDDLIQIAYRYYPAFFSSHC